jgi:hypothetical protein
MNYTADTLERFMPLLLDVAKTYTNDPYSEFSNEYAFEFEYTCHSYINRTTEKVNLYRYIPFNYLYTNLNRMYYLQTIWFDKNPLKVPIFDKGELNQTYTTELGKFFIIDTLVNREWDINQNRLFIVWKP